MNFFLWTLFGALILTSHLFPGERKIQTLYAGLDTRSLSQLLAFYQLYPETPEGKRVLSHVEALLGTQISSVEFQSIALSMLIDPTPSCQRTPLEEKQLHTIEKIGQHLKNRALKGHKIECEEDLILLSPEEIDITRAVLLTQEGYGRDLLKIRSYEAKLDLMALQIAATLPKKASPLEKIEAINRFVFNEMQFRFPSQRKWMEEIDSYTFLPSVLDSHRGVCLGVSILYLGLAQRLGLNLEAVTPPGHIYLRYKKDNCIINIETTARGIHLPCEDYLGIEPPPLETRTIKEVIGLSHINHASVLLRNRQYEQALLCYQKAALYLPIDPQLLELQGCCHLLLGEDANGRILLEQANKRKKIPLIEDYLSGKLDKKGLEIVLIPTGEKREALLKKQEELQTYLGKFPLFRDGWYALAFLFLELHQLQEALKALEAYHVLDPEKLSVEYYLAALNIHLWNYPKAWEHLELVEKQTQRAGHHPKALRQLRVLLMQKSPKINNNHRAHRDHRENNLTMIGRIGFAGRIKKKINDENDLKM